MEDREVAQRLLPMIAVTAVFIVIQLIFGAVGFFLKGDLPLEFGSDPVELGLFVLGVINIIGGRQLLAVLTGPLRLQPGTDPRSGVAERLQRYLTLHIKALAVMESGTIIGLVLALVFDNLLMLYILCATSAFAMYGIIPTRDRLKSMGLL